MSIGRRLLIALVVAVVVGFGVRAYDVSTGAEWVVSPSQIAAAQAKGQNGVTTGPDTVAVLPIRSELADVLPLKWALSGVLAGFVVWVATRRRSARIPTG